jgi:hypothetical protein
MSLQDVGNLYQFFAEFKGILIDLLSIKHKPISGEILLMKKGAFYLQTEDKPLAFFKVQGNWFLWSNVVLLYLTI